MTWYLAPIVFMLTVHIGRAIHDDLIDPYHIADQCKSQLLIFFLVSLWVGGGLNAHLKTMLPGHCGLRHKEVGPAHLGIEDAHSNPDCVVQKIEGLQVYSLSVVIQKGPVRMYNDPYYMVTCSYELMGVKGTDNQETLDSDMQLKPQIVQVGNETATSIVRLSVRDENDQEVQTSSLGDLIQLVAHMEPAEGEVSFRVWNCRALTNDSGLSMEHHILFQGCGDNKLIQADRGFLTSKVTREDGIEMRVARSVFFRTFTFLSSPGLQFECDYIISRDDSADGTSCKANVNTP